MSKYTIVVSYRDPKEHKPQWKEFTGTDKEEVRREFEEFAIYFVIYSAREEVEPS